MGLFAISRNSQFIFLPGGFERGTASFPLYVIFFSQIKQMGTIMFIFRYDGSVIVERSILLGTPIIFASINYRKVLISCILGFNRAINLSMID